MEARQKSKELFREISETNKKNNLKYLYDAKNQSVVSQHVYYRTTNDHILDKWFKFWKQLLLPSGYPSSVSEDYLEYQIYDTAQAFCSSIQAILSTKSILEGVGVGDAESIALSATITWVLKDGMGMLSRIIFAWLKGDMLDANFKKWRFFADILNDLALTIEFILLPILKPFSTYILCLTTSMKSIVGIAGGATRASITQHQAIKGNICDVSAKDSTQETFVNLTAYSFSVFILNYFTVDKYLLWVFTLFTCLHLFTNYKAVKSLKIRTFNEERLVLTLKRYLQTRVVHGPDKINLEESALLGFGVTVKSVTGLSIKIGESIQGVMKHLNVNLLNDLFKIYQRETYVVLPCEKDQQIFVLLKHDKRPETVIKAYVECVLFGVALKKLMKHESIDSCYKIDDIVKSIKFELKQASFEYNRDILKLMSLVRSIVRDDFEKIKIEFLRKNWSLELHQIPIGDFEIAFKD